MNSHSHLDSPGFWSGGAPSSRNAGAGTDPPRPPKDGFEWVWFPEGYWAERRLSNPKSTNESSQKHEIATRPSKVLRWSGKSTKSPKDVEHSLEHHDSASSMQSVSPFSEAQHPFWQLPKDLTHSPYLSEQDQVAALQKSMSRDSTSQAADPRVRDTWKSINADSAIGSPSSRLCVPEASQTATLGGSKSSWKIFQKHNLPEPPQRRSEDLCERTALLDAIPHYFNAKPIPPPWEHTPPRTPATDGSHSTRSKRVSFPPPNHEPAPSPSETAARGSIGLRKWFSLKALRGHKGFLTPDAMSAASPSQDERDAASPPLSPDNFVTFNRPVYLPDATESYPAGVSYKEEARHVETPPLKTDTADGKPRSLFMAMEHAGLKHADFDEDCSDSSVDGDDSPKVLTRTFSYRKGEGSRQREWWDEPKVAVRRNPVKDSSYFEFNMPEHLPSSPMCPANPMHMGKGRLVCVYHGRAKALSDETAGLAEMRDTVRNPHGPEER